MSPEWAAVIVSIVVGVVGLYLGNSIRRQARVARETEAVEKRFEIYAKLWEETQVVAPMDLTVGRRPPLAEKRRMDLYDALTKWFFTDGGGMVLGEPARSIYLRAKENLGADDLDDLSPVSVRDCVNAFDEADRQEARRRIVVRQLSLLRTAMRAELGIFGAVYGPELSSVDKDFLRSCGAKLWRRPWWRSQGPWWRRDWRGRASEWRRRWDASERPEDPNPCGQRAAQT